METGLRIINRKADEDVDIWFARLDIPDSAVEQYQKIISFDEYQRAQRFVFARDRNHYIVARGLLRSLLSCYLGTNPDEVLFDYGPYGKPAIRSRASLPNVTFNLAHSRGVAIYAITFGTEVGIDLEYVRRNIDLDSISQRFFSRNEFSVLQQLPPYQRHRCFFQLWVRKEALVKALGYGLSFPLTSFDVINLNKTSIVPDIEDNVYITGLEWKIWDISLEEDLVASIAMQKQQKGMEGREPTN